MKVLLNNDVGGLALSNKVFEKLIKLGCKPTKNIWSKEFRSNPNVIRAIEEIGLEESADDTILKIVEIPDGVDWYIEQGIGYETIHEVHRTWR